MARMFLTLAGPWASGASSYPAPGLLGMLNPHPTTPRSKEEVESLVLTEGSVGVGGDPAQPSRGCPYSQRWSQETSQPALEELWVSGVERSSFQGPSSPPLHRPRARDAWSPGALDGALTTAALPPQALHVSAPGGQGARRAWARGHHQHRISFHLCKDSLTPEHINILNDSERSWDSRQPTAPPTPLSFLLSFPPVSAPLSPSSLLPLSLSFPPSSSSVLLPFFFLSFLSASTPPPPFPLPLPLPPSPLSPSSQVPTVLGHSQTSHPAALAWGGGAAGPVPLRVCPSPAGPRRQPPPAGRAHVLGPSARRPASCNHRPRGTHSSFLPFAQRHLGFCRPCPMAC